MPRLKSALIEKKFELLELLLEDNVIDEKEALLNWQGV